MKISIYFILLVCLNSIFLSCQKTIENKTSNTISNIVDSVETNQNINSSSQLEVEYLYPDTSSYLFNLDSVLNKDIQFERNCSILNNSENIQIASIKMRTSTLLDSSIWGAYNDYYYTFNQTRKELCFLRREYGSSGDKFQHGYVQKVDLDTINNQGLIFDSNFNFDTNFISDQTSHFSLPIGLKIGMKLKEFRAKYCSIYDWIEDEIKLNIAFNDNIYLRVAEGQKFKVYTMVCNVERPGNYISAVFNEEDVLIRVQCGVEIL